MTSAARPTLDEIRENFAFLDDWEDRYRYLIELGRGLEPLSDSERNDATKVQGCTAQVWMVAEPAERDGRRVIHFRGDSDAHIVRGLIAVLMAIFSGRPPETIVRTEPEPIFAELGLRDHLTKQRSNGLTAMVQRIRRDAEAALAAA